jgi:hypothetical protein
MPRNYLVFGDIEGTLDVLRVECTKCSRRGLYYVHRLIEKHGRKDNMMKWREQLNSDIRATLARRYPERMFGLSYSGAAANIPAINKMNPRANERSSG